jgi:hypothetical protein
VIPKGMSILCQSVISGARRRDDDRNENKRSIRLSKGSKRKRGRSSSLLTTASSETISMDLVAICDRMEVQQLSNLDLSTLSIGNPGVRYICEFLPSNIYVICINLEYSYIGDEGAISLAYALSFRDGAPPMEVLNLTGNHISEMGSEAFGIMLQQHSVRELCISNNAIGDAGFELLSVGLSNVEKLQINGIQLSDAGLWDW